MIRSCPRRDFLRGCAVAGAATLLIGCTKEKAPSAAAAEPSSKVEEVLKIGVSLPSATSYEGQLALDAVRQAAKALDVEIAVIEHEHDAARVAASIKTLASVGCTATIAHVATEQQLDDVVSMASQANMLVAQFASAPTRLALDSDWFVGAAHVDDAACGEALVSALLLRGGPSKAGARRLAVVVAQDDLASGQVLKGGVSALDAWNQAHPDDQAAMGNASYVGDSFDAGRGAVAQLAAAEQVSDALLVVGGDDLQSGVLQGMRDYGMGSYATAACAGMCANLGDAFADGLLVAASGGVYWDASFAFMLAYRARMGKQVVKAGAAWQDVVCPAPVVVDEDTYHAYVGRFLDKTALTAVQIRDFVGKSTDELGAQAAALVEGKQ